MIRGLDVGEVQQWLARALLCADGTRLLAGPGRASRQAASAALRFQPWGDSNSDTRQAGRSVDGGQRDRGLLLARSHFPLALERHFCVGWCPAEDFGAGHSWPPVPDCMLALDEQLRKALPTLLGSSTDGDFVLAYAQVTRMPSTNKITSHVDSPKFGDVIITVGLCGGADIILKQAREFGSGHPHKQKRRSMPQWLEQPHPVQAGDAYVLSALSRWKLTHQVWSWNQVNAPEYGPSTARVAVTLRYFRRSWLRLETRRILHKSRQEGTALTSAEEAEVAEVGRTSTFTPGMIVDVKVRQNASRYPFTYPAIVLAIEARELGGFGRGSPGSNKPLSLRVQFLSDRRVLANAAEAADEPEEWIPASNAIPSAPCVAKRVLEEYPQLSRYVTGVGHLD